MILTVDCPQNHHTAVSRWTNGACVGAGYERQPVITGHRPQKWHRGDSETKQKKKKNSFKRCFQMNLQSLFMPPPLGAGGIMFSGCPSVRPKPEIASFDLYMCPWSTRNRFTACPSVRLPVRPSGEVSGHNWIMDIHN